MTGERHGKRHGKSIHLRVRVRRRGAGSFPTVSFTAQAAFEWVQKQMADVDQDGGTWHVYSVGHDDELKEMDLT